MFSEIFSNSLFCHIRIPFHDGESFAYSPCKKFGGWKKNLHNSLLTKNGLEFVSRFSLDFSILCLISHFKKINMQLKSSLTLIITESFSVNLAWIKPVSHFSY